MEGVCLCHAQYSSTSLACNLVIFTPFKSVYRLEQTAAKIWEYMGILLHSLSNSTCVSAMRRHVLVATPLEH